MSYKKNDANVGPVWVIPSENTLKPDMYADKMGFIEYTPRPITDYEPTSNVQTVYLVLGILFGGPIVCLSILWMMLELKDIIWP